MVSKPGAGFDGTNKKSMVAGLVAGNFHIGEQRFTFKD
jgi:hypothetical protein